MNAVRRAGSVLVALVAVVVAQVAGLSPASATTGPMGRATYVISMMDGKPGAIAVRLAAYSFTADGRVTEKYWGWRQDGVRGTNNVRWTKPSSGYTTAGCLRACPIRTPVGFQKGAAARTASGRWSMESRTVLAIRWSGTTYAERWQLDDGQPGIVGARLVGSGANTAGWGVGSNAPAGRGVPLADIYRTGWWITGPFVENAYSTTTRHLSIGWSAADYSLCASRTCLQGRRMTSADRSTWYHSYFAADSRSDGRKVYWNNQTGVVQHLESPNSQCISASGGGHTNALLQVLDDDGRFVGFVGVEASLNQRKYGQAVVAAYAMIDPSKLSAIGAG